jgi:signal transduction histidine kinase
VAHELNNPLNNIGLFVGKALEALRDGSLEFLSKPHHGDIRVQSDVGRGTEFRVQLLRIA